MSCLLQIGKRNAARYDKLLDTVCQGKKNSTQALRMCLHL
jgi:hypothetical protein